MFETELAPICRDMAGIRKTLEDIQATVDTKLTNEGLMSWVKGPQAHPAGNVLSLCNSPVYKY